MTLSFRCLASITDCPRTAAEVAAHLGVSVKAASDTLTKLRKNGDVFVAYDTEDHKHVYEATCELVELELRA